METIKLNIEDYNKLYKSGLYLNQIKPLNNQTYTVFSKNNPKVKIVNRKEVYKSPYSFWKIKNFINENEFFYMIPVETIRETTVGYIIRGVFTSDYCTISRVFTDPKNQVRLMYGFDKRFSKYDEGSKCYPIIVCEGCKDCISLKKIYPYVVANNTSSMGLNAYILRNISDKFLLAYDNDSAGEEGTKKDKKVLRNLGAFVDNIKLPEGVKDCTDYIYTKNGYFRDKNFLDLKKQIVKKVKSLYNLN